MEIRYIEAEGLPDDAHQPNTQEERTLEACIKRHRPNCVGVLLAHDRQVFLFDGANFTRYLLRPGWENLMSGPDAIVVLEAPGDPQPLH